jgi:hypothetical protein
VFGVEIYITNANAPSAFAFNRSQPVQYVAPVKIGTSTQFQVDYYQFDATSTLRVDAGAGDVLSAEVDGLLGPSSVSPVIDAAATVQ